MMHDTGSFRVRWPRFLLTVLALDVAAIAVGAGAGLLFRLAS